MHLPTDESDSLSSIVFYTDAHIPRLKSLPVAQTSTHLHQPGLGRRRWEWYVPRLYFPTPTPNWCSEWQGQETALGSWKERRGHSHTYKSTHYSLSTKRRSVKIHPVILKQLWSKLGSSQHLAERGCRDEPILCSNLVLLSLVGAGVHAARVGSGTGLASLVKRDKYGSQSPVHRELGGSLPTTSPPLFCTSKLTYKVHLCTQVTVQHTSKIPVSLILRFSSF